MWMVKLKHAAEKRHVRLGGYRAPAQVGRGDADAGTCGQAVDARYVSLLSKFSCIFAAAEVDDSSLLRRTAAMLH